MSAIRKYELLTYSINVINFVYSTQHLLNIRLLFIKIYQLNTKAIRVYAQTLLLCLGAKLIF